MKTRHEVELRMSEIRTELNAESEPANADQLRVEYRQLETDFQTNIKAEQEAEQRQRSQREGDPNTADDGEAQSSAPSWKGWNYATTFSLPLRART